jgi:hypothetical protein
MKPIPQLEIDAARYRWLRSHNSRSKQPFETIRRLSVEVCDWGRNFKDSSKNTREIWCRLEITGADLDAEIDRQMRKKSIKPIPMTVTPIPGEPFRYLVQSESRPDVEHTVDLQYREEPWCKPVAACGCEQIMAKHLTTCKHIRACVAYELNKKTTKL